METQFKQKLKNRLSHLKGLKQDKAMKLESQLRMVMGQLQFQMCLGGLLTT